MQKPLKNLSVAAGIAALAIATAALFFYGGVRHGRTAHAASAPSLLSVLPGGAPTLVYLDLAQIRASGFYQRRPDRGPITIPDENYAEFVRSTGFDFEKDLDAVAIASWPGESTSDPKKNIVVADGRFDRARIRDYAVHKGKVDHQQGHEVFLFPAADQRAASSVTFLDDHRIAIVAGSSIAPLFGGTRDLSATDPARERAARLDGAAAFVITRVPPVPDKFGPGGMQSAQLASLARSVQWVTLAARPEGDDLRVSLEGECGNSTDARQLQAALEVFRMIGRAGLESPKTRQSMDSSTLSLLQTILNGADITQTAERVRILFEVTPDVWKLGGPKQQDTNPNASKVN